MRINDKEFFEIPMFTKDTCQSRLVTFAFDYSFGAKSAFYYPQRLPSKEITGDDERVDENPGIGLIIIFRSRSRRMRV